MLHHLNLNSLEQHLISIALNITCPKPVKVKKNYTGIIHSIIWLIISLLVKAVSSGLMCNRNTLNHVRKFQLKLNQIKNPLY